MDWSIEVENLVTHETWSYAKSCDQLIIGRNHTCTIAIANNYVSREHLILLHERGSCYIEDTGSANGSLIRRGGRYEKLNGRSIVRLPVHVMLGNEISVCISSRDASVGTVKTAIINAQSQPFVSQVISIKNLEKEDAILVLDLCDSTRIASTDETIAFHLKRRLESISRAAISSNHVRFHKSTGDGFFALFPTSLDAFKAAREIIGILMERNQRTTNPPIHVRIALHRGKTYIIDSESGDVHGNDVNMTFRIEGVKKEAFSDLRVDFSEQDRIFCTRQFRDDISGYCASNHLICSSLGPAQLRGIEKSVEIFCINQCS
jgi:class 3 adenylate cyclase